MTLRLSAVALCCCLGWAGFSCVMTGIQRDFHGFALCGLFLLLIATVGFGLSLKL